MPEGKKAYYQVSFTGGQALAAVVVMIAALGAAFFLGSKAGFEKSGEPEAAPTRPAPSAPAAAPSAAPASETSSPSAPDVSTSSSEESPVFEDREAGVAEPSKPSAGAKPKSPSSPSRTELPAGPSGAVAGQGTGPAHPAPVVRSTGTPPPPAAKAETEKPAVGKTGWFVQIVSTSSKSEANRWKEKLAAKKYRTAAVSSVESKKGTLWRVRVGPYGDKDQAKKAAAKITTEFKQKAWVAPE